MNDTKQDRKIVCTARIYKHQPPVAVVWYLLYVKHNYMFRLQIYKYWPSSGCTMKTYQSVGGV